MTELQKKVEAILFAVGKKIHINEIAKLCGTQHLDDVKVALLALQEDHKSRESPLMVFQEGDLWKLSVREKHLPLVHSLVSETELSKSLMETLAVIAWKYPILQSEVIHIRTNKAYDHLKELEAMGFISRVNYGRTKRIKLTEKFFVYFDLPSREEAQQAFRKVLPDALREKIAMMEQEIKDTELVIDEAKRKKEESAEKEVSPVSVDDVGGGVSVNESPDKDLLPVVIESEVETSDSELTEDTSEDNFVDEMSKDNKFKKDARCVDEKVFNEDVKEVNQDDVST